MSYREQDWDRSTPEVERRAFSYFRAFLIGLAILGVMGLVGSMDRETRRQEFQARVEK